MCSMVPELVPSLKCGLPCHMLGLPVPLPNRLANLTTLLAM